MAYYKVVKRKYETEQEVIEIVEYVTNIMKCDHLIGDGNLIINTFDIFCSPDFIAEQFIEVQRFCRGYKRRLYHLVVSFQKGLDDIDICQAKYIADKIIGMYRDFQSLYTIHEDQRNIHIHILFNNCSFIDEKFLSYYLNSTKIMLMCENIITSMMMNRHW